MPLTTFNTAKLATCRNGLIAKMIDKELARMAQDIYAAPDLPTARTVNIKITQKPIFENGELRSVDTSISVNGRTPERAASMNMFVRSNGRQMMFVYSQDAEDNAAQETLPFEPVDGE